ncbi:MAG: carboxypeptidase-like regulatory domain-containing protein [Candidatus Acidiferrales bacterium]
MTRTNFYMSLNVRNLCILTFVCFCVLLGSSRVSAQVSANITGSVTDQSGAFVAGAIVRATSIETGAIRTAATDGTGHYQLLSLPIGQYEVRASKEGFEEEIRKGVSLVVGQDAVVDFYLRVGQISQQITVSGEPAPVTVTTSDISGLVGERQVKNLPLNGRSYDELMTLNPGVVNFTSEKTGGVGVSNSTVGNMFSVAGNRPQQNLFLLNGIEFTGAAENNMQPGGTSQSLLGVDAVREFNVLRDSYGAEYGKRPGGQVIIVTQAGTNQWHGSVYEFLRNNALDAPNFFDQGSAPPFQRSQFGGAMGGPIQTNKTFLFANYEGFRQHLHESDVSLVPDNNARNGMLPCSLVKPTPNPCPSSGLVSVGVAPGVAPLFSLWPVQSAGAPDFGGIAEAFSNPLQTIRDDFGTARIDRIFSRSDSFSTVYTVDDSADNTPTSNPFSTDIESLREQVLSLQETHIFSPSVLNMARFGFSRASYFYTGEPTPNTPATSVPTFVTGRPVGAVVIGGSAASNPTAQVSLAGSNNGSNLDINRNLFTYEDRVSFTAGRHQLSAGAWFQRVQSNESLALSQFGQATFTGLQSFLQGTTASFLFDPTPTPLGWRSLLGAFYVEDVVRIRPKLTLSLGLRDEFTTGWNEASGRAATFIFTNGVMQTQPHIGGSALIENHAKLLPQPRIGVAWSPFSPRTVIRAGFGMYNDLQDALGYRLDQNAPFNPTYSIAKLPVSQLPIDPSAPVPANAKVLPGGVQPDLRTPTLISYSLRVEQEVSPNTTLTIGYVGSHGYHEILSLDANEPFPTICPAAPCPADLPTPPFAPNTPVPAGAFFIPANTPNANPALGSSWAWNSEGTSSYNALQVDVNHRVSEASFAKGLAFRGVYTWSKALDNGDSLNGTAAGNAPGLVANPFNLRADWGPATYDVRNVGVFNASYRLPFGNTGRYFAAWTGWRATALSGWTVNSIVTLQSGFPFTPQLSYNPSNNGDTRNPVRPFVNPAFTGPVITGNVNGYFNPAAFLAPPPNSGFYGNLGRDTLTGPGLATWDFSAFKDTRIHERMNLEFRAEIFNLLNRANFNTPNAIAFTPTGVSPSAGVITSTSTTSRQVQFGLKLLW